MRMHTSAQLLIVCLVAIGCSSASELAGLPDRQQDSTTAEPDPSAGSNMESEIPLVIDPTFTVIESNSRWVLQTSMIATNTSATPFSGKSGPHPWRLSIFSDSTRSHRIWDLDGYLTRGPHLGRQFTIPSGGSHTFDSSWFPLIPLDSILKGRSPGRYFASMELLLDEPQFRSQPLPAGDLILRYP